jgi:hypothetical protein
LFKHTPRQVFGLISSAGAFPDYYGVIQWLLPPVRHRWRLMKNTAAGLSTGFSPVFPLARSMRSDLGVAKIYIFFES